jgi:hypothetical protein
LDHWEVVWLKTNERGFNQHICAWLVWGHMYDCLAFKILEDNRYLWRISTVWNSVRKRAECIINIDLLQNIIEDRLMHGVNSIVFALNIKINIDWQTQRCDDVSRYVFTFGKQEKYPLLFSYYREGFAPRISNYHLFRIVSIFTSYKGLKVSATFHLHAPQKSICV